MRKLLGLVALATLLPMSVYAEVSGLEWAYPVNPPPGAPNPDLAEAPKTVNRNLVLRSYTGLPLMPPVVATGKPIPCMQCHLANGNGHPESADISGLSVNYIIKQVHAFRDDERADSRSHKMVEVAKVISEDDLKAAAAYYAAIPPERFQWTRTVVASEAPKGDFTFGPGSYRIPAPDGGAEPIPPGRVIEVAENEDLLRARDQLNGGFVQYVRPDDLALGEQIVTMGDHSQSGDGVANVPPSKCSQCHGADLKGKNDVPRLAGRQPMYLIRALNDFRTGANKTKSATPMKRVVAKMSDRDIVAVAAYLASLAP
ncbi:MAG TPA: c-type cytochrome [Caulobacteraceae bacterium]|nr:c-type cytochrome [Caulobacteraceae bacterium]